MHKKTSILHICSYYAGSKVYENLFSAIGADSHIESQDVFVPLRHKRITLAAPLKARNIHIHTTLCLNFFTRLSLALKQFKLSNEIKIFLKKSPHKKYNIIHAHTLYSDGILAWKLSKSLQIPYVITVRTTDVSLFHKLTPHWRSIIKKVLQQAQDVIFISPSHQALTISRYPNNSFRSHVIPNGIDPYWIKHSILSKPHHDKDQVSALYIGKINKNKNIKRAITAFFEARLTATSRKFTIIGGSYAEFQAHYGSLEENILKNVQFLGNCSNKDELKRHYVNADIFIMPSHMETFGLVYLESISQCTPVIYSQAQGIDGLKKCAQAGNRCNPKSIKSIKEAIELTLSSYPNGLVFSNHNIAKEFSWTDIASLIINKSYAI